MSKQCSFCLRDESPEVVLLEGAEASICKECAETCVDELQVTTHSAAKKGLKPQEIKAELDKYVVGQEEAKKMLSVAVYNHYKRIEAKTKVNIRKSNILITGPTGSGKTYLIQTLARILDVPLVIADANSLTQAGYVGDDVESVLENLVIKAGGDVKKAERGIVYLDEIDKVATSDTSGSQRAIDVGGKGVQESLLKIIEDSEVHLKVGGMMSRQRLIINTKNILFIFGGAFVGLDTIVQKRLKSPNKTLGFTAAAQIAIPEEDKDITQKDLVDFGFIPEFVGRIPVLARLNPLTKEDMMNILTTPKDSVVKEYEALLKMEGVKLKFSKSAIEYIAEEALRKNVGARGLKGILERKMYDFMYQVPSRADNGVISFTITKEMLMGNAVKFVEQVK